MRISDWSSDVCSSDLPEGPVPFDLHVLSLPPAFVLSQDQTLRLPGPPTDTEASNRRPATQRLLQACILQVVTTLECTQGSRRQTTAGRRPRIPSNPINNVKEQASPKGPFRHPNLPENPPGEPTGQTTRVATANYKDPHENWQSKTTKPPAPDPNPHTENQPPAQETPDTHQQNQPARCFHAKNPGNPQNHTPGKPPREKTDHSREGK